MSDTHEHLHAMRHSLAHITASAVKKLWPEAKFGVGPVVENGFYYDIDLGEQKAPGVLVGQPVQDRHQRLARPAPRRPEIDQHRTDVGLGEHVARKVREIGDDLVRSLGHVAPARQA